MIEKSAFDLRPWMRGQEGRRSAAAPKRVCQLTEAGKNHSLEIQNSQEPRQTTGKRHNGNTCYYCCSGSPCDRHGIPLLLSAKRGYQSSVSINTASYFIIIIHKCNGQGSTQKWNS